ncbi:MAG: hypothetical protein Q4E73_00015 [Lachnospiraceae bacterium]|nr:hypothetical protein [Lachnospiraceae bacterium]
MTNKERYKKVFDVLASSEPISLEVDQMKENKQKKYKMKHAAAAAVCVIILGVSTSVYAVANYFGIIDFVGRTSMEVTKKAESQIQMNPDTSQKRNDTIFNCAIKEALCDSQTITLVYEVSAMESGKYLFIPEDATPKDDMGNWSDVRGKSAKEYASEKDLTIVNIGGNIVNSEELGITEETLDFQSVCDDTMDIFITCRVAKQTKTRNVDVTATGRISDTNDVMRLESNFELQDMSTTETTVYADGKSESIQQFFRIEKAEVIQTDLGTYIDVYYINRNGQNPEDGLTFRVTNLSDDWYEGGAEQIKGDHYKARYRLNKCEIGETLNLEAFDCFEKNVYGVTVLQKQN